ncbi:MAG: PfkB family carbohydrate kinase [Verrucomicrobiota bacterium]
MPTTPAASPRVLAFGEVLWDVYGEGREFIGGAPFNCAAHAVRCGLEVDFYSRIGTDARGSLARAQLARLGVGERWLQIDPVHRTGWVDVTLRSGQPSYSIGADAAWDWIEAPSPAAAEAIVTTDYAGLICGTLAQRSPTSRAALRRLRESMPGAVVLYDVNLRPPYTPLDIVRSTLRGVTLLKVNDVEAEQISRAWWDAPFSPETFFSNLAGQFGLQALVLTRGADGASVTTASGTISAPPVATEVVSAVGAGDAFAAAFLAGWLRSQPLPEVLDRANRLGSWVVSQAEAIPDYPPELRLG